MSNEQKKLLAQAREIAALLENNAQLDKEVTAMREAMSLTKNLPWSNKTAMES